MLATRARMGASGVGGAAPAAPPTFRSFANTAINFINSHTVTKPAGTAAGDMLAAFVLHQDTATITVPSGFTHLATTASAPGTTSKMLVYTKLAGGSEPASYVWGLSGTRWSQVVMAAYAPSAPGKTINVGAPSTSTNASGTTHTYPSVAAQTAADALLGAMVISGGSTQNITAGAGTTERIDLSHSTFSFYLQDEGLSASGATGTRTSTMPSARSSAVMSFTLYET